MDGMVKLAEFGVGALILKALLRGLDDIKDEVVGGPAIREAAALQLETRFWWNSHCVQDPLHMRD